MKGLIKKDLFMLKNNARYFLVFTFVYFLIAFNQKESSSTITFVLPFLTIIMIISTFSYDEFNNWYSYASTLPNGRRDIVKSKYLITGVIAIFATILSDILAIAVGHFNANAEYGGIVSSLVGSIFACILLMSIMYPFLFKYGSEKGRLLIFAISFIIVGGAALISKISNFHIPKNVIIFLDNYGIILIVIASVIMIAISYLISKRIFSKKEF